MKPEYSLCIAPGWPISIPTWRFGLCNRAVEATTYAGPEIYMAPEMFRKGGQTSKLDVWSLFVTMLRTLDVGGFRQKSYQFQSVEDAQEAVLFAASKGDISKIQEMAIINPERRAFAAQMLVKYFSGEGFSTPRNKVPALISPRLTIAPAKASLPAPPARTAQTKQRGLQQNPNGFAAAA